MDNYLCHFRPDSLHREPKLIVTMSSLHQLLMSCTECAGETTYRMTEVRGTYVKFEIRCPSCLHSRTWETSPKVGYSFSMNVILSGAILFTGASSAKTLRVLAEAGIYVPCDRTYGNIQSDYLFGVSKYGSKRNFLSRSFENFLMNLVHKCQPTLRNANGLTKKPAETIDYMQYRKEKLQDYS